MTPDMQPRIFEGNIDKEKATILFEAIILLDNGMFPDIIKQLTSQLCDTFNDIKPSAQGIKTIGNLKYSSYGICCDNMQRKIVMPVFELETEKADDKKDRIEIVKNYRYWNVTNIGNFSVKQIIYEMSGKKPSARMFVVGRTLKQISKITEKLEKSKERLSGISEKDYQETFWPLFDKLEAKIINTLGGRLSKYFDYPFINHENPDGENERSHAAVTYIDAEIAKEAAKALLNGTLTDEKLHDIMTNVTKRENMKTLYFTPMENAMPVGSKYLHPKAYEKEIEDYILQNGSEQRDVYGFCPLSYYGTYLVERLFNIITMVYDAIQMYHMYDSRLTDKDTRRFFTDAGYIIDGWSPDPQLWYRIALLFPLESLAPRYNPYHFPEDIIAGITEIIKKHIPDGIIRLKEKLHPDDIPNAKNHKE